MSAVLAMVKRDLLISRRYPVGMINLTLLTPLYQMALPTLLLGAAFLVNGDAQGLARLVGTTDLAGWVGLGMLMASVVVGVMWTVAGDLMSDRMSGVLEYSWSTRTPREQYVWGSVCTSLLFTVVANSILLGLAVTLLDARYSPMGLLLSLPVLAVTAVGVCGFGYLVGAATLAVRRTTALLDTAGYLLSAFSGVAFPLAVLPGGLRQIGYLLPSTWGLDLIRYLTMASDPLAPVRVELALLAITSAVFFVGGRAVFRRTERSLRRSGTLSQF